MVGSDRKRKEISSGQEVHTHWGRSEGRQLNCGLIRQKLREPAKACRLCRFFRTQRDSGCLRSLSFWSVARLSTICTGSRPKFAHAESPMQRNAHRAFVCQRLQSQQTVRSRTTCGVESWLAYVASCGQSYGDLFQSSWFPLHRLPVRNFRNYEAINIT